MQDRQLYEQILGISAPWHVQRVELQLKDGEVHVHLEHTEQAEWRCPQCDRDCAIHDHGPPRVWRHLDTCQYQTLLHAAIPRTKCPEHGVLAVRVAWAEPHSRFTALFERLVIDWLLAASQQAVADRLKLSWDEVHGIMHRAVKRGLERRPTAAARYLGVDEKAFRRGHRYVTIVSDLETGRVLHVAEDRQQASLDSFWTSVPVEQLTQIEAVAMDMWDPYVTSTRAHLPGANAKIVYDKFHVAKHLGEGVDQVRRAENKLLRATGDDRLVGTKYDWLRHPDSFADDAAYRRFCRLRRSNLKTARAWAMKEQAMAVWEYRYVGAARRHFDHWYRWVTHSRLPPMIKKAKMLKKRLANVLTYLTHGITNATSESINSKIQWLKYTARGFRNIENFKTAILFHCGGLNLSHSAT
jgi:transposase